MLACNTVGENMHTHVMLCVSVFQPKTMQAKDISDTHRGFSQLVRLVNSLVLGFERPVNRTGSPRVEDGECRVQNVLRVFCDKGHILLAVSFPSEGKSP